jgi:hypothetical protein
LISDLKEENARLKKMLESGKIDPALAAQLSNNSGSTGDCMNIYFMTKIRVYIL